MLAQYTQRLSRLIEDLFEVSKVNSGNIQLNLMELDVKALIEQAQAECSELLQEKHLQVITSSVSYTHLSGIVSRWIYTYSSCSGSC